MGSGYLTGNAVDLRPPAPEDLPFLCETVNDPRVWRTVSHRDPVTEHAEREWYESLDERDGVDLVIVTTGDDRQPVGVIGYGDVNENWGVAEVGYMIHPDHWNRGYATEATGLLTEYAFGEKRLAKLAASAYAHNPASMRVLEKAGYHEEAVLEREAFVAGERVDLHRYAAFADDWERPERTE